METLQNRISKFFSVGPKSTFLLVLLIIGCFTIIYNLKKKLQLL